MSTNITFSIIILSYNTKKILEECLDSIYKFSKGVSYEVIVIDHNSRDDSVKMLQNYKKSHKNLVVLAKKDNPGFGAGNNNAAQVARGKYLVLLNSDTLFTSNILRNIEKKIGKFSDLGIYSIKLLNADRSFQGSGGSFPTLLNLLLWQFGIDDIPILGNYVRSFHPKENSKIYSTGPDWVTGAYMVIPRDVFESVSGFDENIFMYTEEMELAYRIAKTGKKTLYDPSEEIVHLGGASGGSFLALTSEVKNLIYFWKKHKPAWQIPIVKLLFATGSLLRLIFFGIIKQNESYRKAYIECLRLSL